MEEWIRRLNHEAIEKTDTMLVITVQRDGSTPGASHAKMLVTRRGRIFGTIGGGQLEYHCVERAMELLEQKRCAVERYELNTQDKSGLGMICGGAATVWFHYLKEAALPGNTGKSSWLCLEQDSQGNGHACMSDDLKAAYLPEKEGSGFEQGTDGIARYRERLCEMGIVYMFGAGHVAQSLVPGLARVGFSCRVLDDRQEFARAVRFPDAEEVCCIGPESLKKVCSEIQNDDYVCVMTHGHRYDHEVVRHVLRTPACYIGVMGSVRKAQASAQRLREEGFTDQDLARLNTPIGLAIGAETPEEIAVSIVAQLIETRARRRLGQEKL